MRVMIGVVTALLAPLVLCPGVSAQPQSPEGILVALENAYRSKDIAAYAALLAPEFEFVSKEGTGWNAEKDRRMAEGAFEKSDELILEFSRDFRMEPLTSTGTWAIRRIPVRLTDRHSGQTYTIDTIQTLYLRLSEETGRVLIYRWIDEWVDETADAGK